MLYQPCHWTNHIFWYIVQRLLGCWVAWLLISWLVGFLAKNQLKLSIQFIACFNHWLLSQSRCWMIAIPVSSRVDSELSAAFPEVRIIPAINPPGQWKPLLLINRLGKPLAFWDVRRTNATFHLAFHHIPHKPAQDGWRWSLVVD